ncbi:huntingtin-interacting protein 1 isoform X2 [Folsomia candida]|uniref:huntingtin-interacting protein 1 isoform X2 n=1 Tax=Folsomia candida TaxID=158441 RepID=UPI000B8FC29F|nr:huntingtin-interacting protein 1 isoform X2 [Folsomia candida]
MSLQLPRFQSKKNSLELEREHFEKGQATSLSKAINTQETAVKEKHVRSAIIGTYQERGASTFWECVHRLPTKEHAVLCWKFCFVLHKVLREGHENVIRDSQRYKPMLRELGKFWGLLKSGFGGLIKDYCALLEIKLTFHLRNQRIPGNLDMDYADLVNSVGDNEDAFFQLSVEMLDYLDAILELQADIFKTMDQSRCNSMTPAGQCRLTPLIPCIQDSMILYDYTTKILFHLHSKLSPDLLEGHRQRFLKVFRELSQLYEKTMSLQYFKNLIAIQLLPKNPPNFLIQSDIENYETRKVTVYNSGDLIDVDNDETNKTNESRSSSPDLQLIQMERERDKRIRELEDEVKRLNEYIVQLREQAGRRIRELQAEISLLTDQLTDKNSEIGAKDRKIAELLSHECKIPNDIAERMDVAEKKNVGLEEKFSKMKNMYTNLREQHVDLLRKKGASDKEIGELRKVVDGQSEMSSLVESLRKEKEEVESNLFNKLSKKDTQVEELDSIVVELKSQIESIESAKKKIESDLETELTKAKNEIEMLLGGSSSLEKLNKSLVDQLDTLSKKCDVLGDELALTASSRDNLSKKCDDVADELALTAGDRDNLSKKCDDLVNELALATGARDNLSKKCDDVADGLARAAGDRDNLSKKCDDLANELALAAGARDNFQSQINDLQRQIQDNQKNMENESIQRYNELLNVCIQECEGIMRKTIEDLENPLLTGGTGALDHFIINCRGTGQIIGLMEAATKSGYSAFPSLREILERVPPFTHHMVNLILHGSATSQTSADIQKGDEMLGDCRNLGSSILSLLGAIRTRLSGKQLADPYNEIRDKLQKLLSTASSLGSSLTPEADAAEALENELLAMERAIEEASKKMEEMLKNSRESHTGVKLEVNEKLIDSCTTLMNAIRLLVQRAKFLQSEIVSQGKGSTSVKEFYKRNHQWTEGLISAAKAVGGGAKFLLESADKAVTNPTAGFELLIASSQDIAASTIQLVVASQVRADRSSQNLSLLKQASTGVKTATAGVVATAKDCAQLIEESDEVDLAKLSTHNAKRLELETQAEVLRLQTELEKSRMKLSALRQHHYHNSD